MNKTDLVELAFQLRNHVVLLGRDSPARDEILAKADAALAEYPPFIEQEKRRETFIAEAKANGWYVEMDKKEMNESS